MTAKAVTCRRQTVGRSVVRLQSINRSENRLFRIDRLADLIFSCDISIIVYVHKLLQGWPTKKNLADCVGHSKCRKERFCMTILPPRLTK